MDKYSTVYRVGYCIQRIGFRLIRRRLLIHQALLVVFILSSVCIYCISIKSYGTPPTHFLHQEDGDYLLKNGTTQYAIQTSTCKIPEFVPWSVATQLLRNKCKKYYTGEPKCEEKHPHSWIYVDGDHLVANMTAIHSSGYSWSSIRCCFRIIERVEQSLDNYNMEADRIIRYSDDCHRITEQRQKVDAEFIRVFCISTSFPTFGSVVSREFLAIAKPDEHARNKIEKWNTISEDKKPPSVLLLGLDTMSRLNTHRNFNTTMAVLRSLGAIEMHGYTKVGESTFPNTVAFMSGYSIRDMRQFCYQTTAVAQDFCPYIWKAFDKVGYLTSTIEDVPYGASFNFLKAGFVHKPVDFFFRPLMLAVMKHQPRDNGWYIRCIGKSTIEDVVLKYVSDILHKASANAPVFIHSWSAVLAHECSNAAKFGDTTFANFIEETEKSNTIIMFMSDHGDIYGDFRETVQGWYEDKLPTLWVYLPPKIRQRFPDWYESLQINSKRLTSPFDMYKTLVQILRTFDTDQAAHETYDRISSQPGQSLFQEVPEKRTCLQAGIPDGYCACSEPRNIDVNDVKVKSAAIAAFKYMSEMLPDECEVAVLTEIVKAKYFDTPSDTKVYIISFVTDPGHFLFEGTVREGKNGELEVTNEILRMNKIIRKADCVGTPLLERYCYCK